MTFCDTVLPSHHTTLIQSVALWKYHFTPSLSAYDFASYNLEKKRSHTGLPHLPLPNLPAHLHIAFCLLKEFILRPDLPIVLLIPSSLTTQRNWSWNYLFSSGSSPSLLEHLHRLQTCTGVSHLKVLFLEPYSPSRYTPFLRENHLERHVYTHGFHILFYHSWLMSW